MRNSECGVRSLNQRANALGARLALILHSALRIWNGCRGRSCTCNLPGLSGTPLLIGLHAGGLPAQAMATAGAPGQDCTDTKRGLSPLPLPWATGAFEMRNSECEVRNLTSLGRSHCTPRSFRIPQSELLIAREGSGFPSPTRWMPQVRMFAIAKRGPPPTSPS